MSGIITEGNVCEKPIQALDDHQLSLFSRIHLFAGIGGWDYALQLAGWPSGRSVWTASCPCQPFSSAGHARAEADSRHLWPQTLRLVKKFMPATLFGEQVTGKANIGLQWFARVRSDLEALGYSVGAADLCAAGVQAPCVRPRLWFVASLNSKRWEPQGLGRSRRAQSDAQHCGSPAANLSGPRGERLQARPDDIQPGKSIAGNGRGIIFRSAKGARRKERPAQETARHASRPGSLRTSPWDHYEIAYFREKGQIIARRIEPRLEPLVNGLPGRVGALRGYGNSINPHVAALFIESFLEAERGD